MTTKWLEPPYRFDPRLLVLEFMQLGKDLDIDRIVRIRILHQHDPRLPIDQYWRTGSSAASAERSKHQAQLGVQGLASLRSTAPSGSTTGAGISITGTGHPHASAAEQSRRLRRGDQRT